MLSVATARTRILENFKPVSTTSLAIVHAAGRVLAGDVTAKTDLPLFDNSSMDGFALHVSDVAGASQSSPQMLKVVADIRAGTSSDIRLKTGECARIMTGAPLPPEADAVVMLADTDFQVRTPGTPAPATVSVYKPVHQGENIRHRADDLNMGDTVMHAGTRLRAQEIGLLAMPGISEVQVYRYPRLALLSSGDELLPVEAPLTPGKIHESNSTMLAALAESSGVELVHLGVASDSEADIRTHLDRAVDEKVDAILSSAGVSMGAFDYVRSIIETNGRLDFWKVDMRPGKPLAFGEYKGIPFFGLPGNPVSAFIGFIVYVRPALERLSGQTLRQLPRLKARLAEPIESDGRESYLRTAVTEEEGHLVARPTGHQGSGNIFSLVQANALLIVPSGVKSLPADTEVEIWLIE